MMLKHFFFSKILIVDQNSIFFFENFNCWPKFDFFSKILIVDQNSIFFSKILIVDQNSIFFENVNCWPTFDFFFENFNCWPKFDFFFENFIIWQKFPTSAREIKYRGLKIRLTSQLFVSAVRTHFSRQLRCTSFKVPLHLQGVIKSFES